MLGSKFSENLRKAFIEKDSGKTRQYGAIVQTMSDPKTNLIELYLGLSKVVTFIKSSYVEFFEVLWKFDWTHPSDTIDSYIEFLVHLNSAHGNKFLKPTFECLVSHFKPKAIERTSNDPYSGFDIATLDKVTPLIHRTVKRLIKSNTSATTSLSEVISQQFPHRSHPLPVQHHYLKNILKIVDYEPILQQQILRLTVDRIIQIDVQIKLEEIPDEVDETFIFGMDELEADIVKEHMENAEKLDLMIDVVIEFINSRSSNDLDQLFVHLVRTFDAFILTTHKSKYTQFILFYMCSMKSRFCERFIQYLFSKFNSESSIITKLTSSAYIGSFIGRSQYVSMDVIKSTTTNLTQWTHNYLDSLPRDEPPDAEKHALFYSACQSILYILCFKGMPIYEFQDSFLNTLNIDRLVCSSLNPFKLVLSEVVKEFSRISLEIGLGDWGKLIEQNNYIVLPSTSSFGGSNHLDTFFPFDPYLLRTSSAHFDGLYQHWKIEEDVPVDSSVQGIPIQDPDSYWKDDLSLSLSMCSLDDKMAVSLEEIHPRVTTVDHEIILDD